MLSKLFLLVLPALLLSAIAHAQQGEASGQVQIRAVLHDPIHPEAELYLPDPGGKIIPLILVPANLSALQTTLPVNGSLVLYDKAVVDPKNPQASLAATVRVPQNMKKGIVIIIPSPEGSKPAYRMVLIEDTPTAFPKGESRVLSLLPVETAVQAGEHKLPVKSGIVTSVPVVNRVNEFNIAQTNFYYKDGENWIAFTERQLQFLPQFRRIFIIYVTPGSTQPFINTIVDTAL